MMLSLLSTGVCFYHTRISTIHITTLNWMCCR